MVYADITNVIVIMVWQENFAIKYKLEIYKKEFPTLKLFFTVY